MHKKWDAPQVIYVPKKARSKFGDSQIQIERLQAQNEELREALSQSQQKVERLQKNRE